MSEENAMSCTPPELREVAQSAINDLLPKKSRPLYEKEYKIFQTWCGANNVSVITENVMLAYFEIQSKTKKSSTLWRTYSMLKSCLNIYKNVDISNFKKLQSYLKTLSKGYTPKKSKVLEAEEVNRFIDEADDERYLAIKVVLILGYCGACRREEITNISIDDVEFKTDVIMVSIRPQPVSHKRLLLTYRRGQCVNCPIGINTIGKMPKIIAEYLELPNAEYYTGHCFRRSSVTNLANRGGDLVTIKRLGGWRSSAIAESYIETSVKKKIEVAQMFSPEPSTSNFFENPSAMQSSDIINTNPVIESVGNQTATTVSGVEHNFVSEQNLPANITINASDTANVTVKVFNNCTISN